MSANSNSGGKTMPCFFNSVTSFSTSATVPALSGPTIEMTFIYAYSYAAICIKDYGNDIIFYGFLGGYLRIFSQVPLNELTVMGFTVHEIMDIYRL